MARPLVPGMIYYWPPNAPYSETVEAFLTAYGTLGYEWCPTGNYEPGFEKIAIFTKDGVVKHVAKLLAADNWTSKFGGFQDAIHTTAAAVGGGDYGEAEAYMKRSTIRSPENA